jgi:pimeloyl-ACP methyl ester carboxylesterase
VRIDHRRDGLFVREQCLATGPLFEQPLLFVHGRCTGWWIWQRWLGYFAAAGWPCFALSLRGHEGSRALSEAELLATTLADYVEDIDAVREWLGRPAVLFGHSMGGIAVQRAAERGETAALALIASVGPSQMGKPNIDLPLDRPVEDREYYLERGDWHLARRVVPESPRALNDGRGRSPIDRQRIVCPVVAVGGELDDTRVYAAARLAEFYGGGSIVSPGAGHDLMLGPSALWAAARIHHWLLDKLVEPDWKEARG